MSPERFHSNVLEQRVFNSDVGKRKMKKRPKSVSAKQSLRKVSFAKQTSKYSNPGDRP